MREVFEVVAIIVGYFVWVGVAFYINDALVSLLGIPATDRQFMFLAIVVYLPILLFIPFDLWARRTRPGR